MNNLYILVWSFIAILATWENLNSSTETLLVVEQENRDKLSQEQILQYLK